MNKHEVRHKHVHIEIPEIIYDALKKKHPGYGGVSEAIRKLLARYVDIKLQE